MPWKVSFLVDYLSEPTDLAAATGHKGGWSETYWWIGSEAPNVALTDWSAARAPLLPKGCRIIGARVQSYTLVGGHLVAGGTNATQIQRAGNAAFDQDLPQVSLGLVGRSGSSPNTRRFTLRGIPDAMMKFGEYQPEPGYKGWMTRFLNMVASGGWGFPGRDLTKPSIKIVSLGNSVLKVEDGASFAVGDYVRLLKVKDINGKPVTGAYRISVKADASLTLENIDPNITCKNVGRARNDATAFFQIADVQIGRAMVRKVGRPFEQYRGRRSKRR